MKLTPSAGIAISWPQVMVDMSTASARAGAAAATASAAAETTKVAIFFMIVLPAQIQLRADHERAGASAQQVLGKRSLKKSE